MITKLFKLLFVPSQWVIIKEETISYKEKTCNYVYGEYAWSHHKGIRYTLQNQYGDLKFVTKMDY